VVEGCKSHFRGIKPYYLLAIVRSRILKNGAHARKGDATLMDVGTLPLPAIEVFLKCPLP